MIYFVIIASFALPLLSAAQLVPTAPGPGDVFMQGGQCSISWTADTSGTWKQTNIELMTGPNQQMIHLATVATVDGTDPTKTSISVPCLGVTPNSAIYFYQFTAQGQNATWTGRFAISGSAGATTTPPPNANQPDGSPIPWGVGKLLDPTQGTPPPSTAPPGQINGSSGTASNGSSSASTLPASGATLSSTMSSSSSSVVVVTASSSSAVSASSSSGMSTVRVSAATSAAVASSTPAPATAAGSSPNGAAIKSRSTVVVSLAATILGLVSLC